MHSLALVCQVFKSHHHEGMYLYVEESVGLAQVPESLLKHFGNAQSVMVLPLSATQKLALAEAVDVIASIQERGYYLQMPVQQITDMTQMALKNAKLAGIKR